jgi:MFS family permease
VRREEQGGAAAIMSAAPAAGFVFGPLIGAGLYQIEPSLPYYAASCAMFAFAIYAFRVTSKRPLEADR